MSCGSDVEGELALELEKPVASPETTIGTDFFRIVQNYFPVLGWLWFLTTGPLI